MNGADQNDQHKVLWFSSQVQCQTYWSTAYTTLGQRDGGEECSFISLMYPWLMQWCSIIEAVPRNCHSWTSVYLSYLHSLKDTPREDKRHYNPQRQLPLRLTERPFPGRIPISSDSVTKGRPLCEVCRARGIRSQTRYRCKVCHTPLHMEKCFEIYHTTLHYGH